MDILICWYEIWCKGGLFGMYVNENDHQTKVSEILHQPVVHSHPVSAGFPSHTWVQIRIEIESYLQKEKSNTGPSLLPSKFKVISKEEEKA